MSKPIPTRSRLKKPPPVKHGVVVVGSLNMDLVVTTESIPLPGQTVTGQNLREYTGGKGANQAAAAAKLSGQRARAGQPAFCRLIGRTGHDAFGARLREALESVKVDISAVLPTRHVPTGVALIMVDRHGENAIVVAGGANRHLHSEDLLACRKTIETAHVLAAQLETPYDTVACAFALAKQARTLTLLDPAPVPPDGIPESLYHVDIITPNQLEAQALTGVHVRGPDDARRAGERLLGRGAGTAIVKLGAGGAVVVGRTPEGTIYSQHLPGFRVAVVDTTAAGDCFTGALAVALAEGQVLAAAVRFANAAAALTCTRAGAQAALPTRHEVEAFLRQHGGGAPGGGAAR